MQTESSFFGSVGAILGAIIRAIVEFIQSIFGGFGSAVGDFFSGMAGALGMSASVFNFILLLIGLLMIWAAIKAFMQKSVLSGIFWVVLAMLLLGALIGG